MATLTFKEQYLHPNWQRKRLEVMQDAQFACENCGDTTTTLNVHHKRYVKGRMVWEYERSELSCLCETCHESHHASKQALDLLLTQVSVGTLPSLVALIAGYIDGSMAFEEGFESVRFVGERQMEFELGLLASMLDGYMPNSYLLAVSAARALQHFSPPQDSAIARWREFTDKLEKSGL